MSKWGHSLPISVFKRRKWIFQWSIPFNSFCFLPHIVTLCQIPWHAMLASPCIKILFFFAIIKSITLAPAALPANQLSHPPSLPFQVFSSEWLFLVPDREEQPKCQDWQNKPRRDSQPRPLWVLAPEMKVEAAESWPTALLTAPFMGRELGRSVSLFLCGHGLHIRSFTLLPCRLQCHETKFSSHQGTAFLALKVESKGRKGSNRAPQNPSQVASASLCCPFLLFKVRVLLCWSERRELLRSQFLPNSPCRVLWILGQSFSRAF